MGIGIDTIDLLIDLKKAGYLCNQMHVAEIGAQQLANTFLSAADRTASLGMLFGITYPFNMPAETPSHVVHGALEHLSGGAPPSRDFWLWLGCDYTAIDIDGSPGSIPLDLNYDSAPEGEIKKYDLVTNFGTTEHIANQLNAFKIIHDLTKHGGLMIHQLPAGGFLNHGLVNYNMKFFWMLARSNGYSFIRAMFGQNREAYGLLPDIADFLATMDPTSKEKTEGFTFADAGVLVILEKAFDIEFVAPLDVPTGTNTNIDALKRRYWTVFDPNAFEVLRAKGFGPYRR